MVQYCAAIEEVCGDDAEWCRVELACPSDVASSSRTKYYNLTLDDGSADQVLGREAEESRQGTVCLRLSFLRPQRAVTPGQAVVLYGPILPESQADEELPPQRGFGSDVEHSRATVGATDTAGIEMADHIDETVICAATIAFPGQSLYEQGVTSTALTE